MTEMKHILGNLRHSPRVVWGTAVTHPGGGRVPWIPVWSALRRSDRPALATDHGEDHVKTRITAAVAAATALALGLSACSQTSDAEPTASPTSTTSEESAATVEFLQSVAWNEGKDGIAELEFEPGVTFADTGAVLVADGDGAEATEGTVVTVSYIIYSGTDGSVYYSSYDDGYTEGITMTEGAVDPNLYSTLLGVHEGAQLLYGTFDTSDGSALIMAVTVEAVTEVLDRAEGTAVDPVEGLPAVTLDDATGEPTVSFDAAGDKPTELVAQDLITGDGAVVAEGDQVTVHYTGWLWDGDVFDSSWERGAGSTFTLATGSLIDGWVQGLVGKTVGSQVLLVVPPELGYGDADSGTIPAGSTLVFVVDILAAQ